MNRARLLSLARERRTRIAGLAALPALWVTIAWRDARFLLVAVACAAAGALVVRLLEDDDEDDDEPIF